MIRPSALNLAQHCRQSAELAKVYEDKNDDADRGTQVHAEVVALSKGATTPHMSPDAVAIWQWIRATFDHPLDICYHEQHVRVLDPDTGALITEGTCDLLVRHDLGGGACGVTVVDYKSQGQKFAGMLPEIEDDLQTDAYAVGGCQKLGGVGFRKCFLYYGEGEVHPEWSMLWPADEIERRLEQIRVIEFEPPRYTTGPHCSKCYARMHCPAWMLPAHQGESALAPFSEPGGLTLENAPQAIQVLEAMDAAVDRAWKQVRELARREGGIVSGDRRYGVVMMPGRRSANLAAIEAAGPEAIEKFTKVGAPYEQFRWLKKKSA